jgi:hypothetical protein
MLTRVACQVGLHANWGCMLTRAACYVGLHAKPRYGCMLTRVAVGLYFGNGYPGAKC